MAAKGEQADVSAAAPAAIRALILDMGLFWGSFPPLSTSKSRFWFSATWFWERQVRAHHASLAATRKYPEGPMTFTRRHFIQTSSALAGASGLGLLPAAAKPLSFRFGYSAISWDTDIEEAIKVGQRVGLPGIEPF